MYTSLGILTLEGLSFKSQNSEACMYTLDSLQREIRDFEYSLQRVRKGTPPYPTCCYARYCFKFERALPHSSGGRGVDELLVVGNDDAFV